MSVYMRDGFVDYEHYNRMVAYTGITLEYARENNYEPEFIGASSDLRDISLQKLIECPSAVFIDIDSVVLDKIEHILNQYDVNCSYYKIDITGAISTIQKSIVKIYLAGFSSVETIKQIMFYFSEFNFIKEEIYKEQVLLSLNVISELQPPIRAFVEKMHRFVFGESIENSVDSMTLNAFKKANKMLYRKFVDFHLRISEQYVYSNYFVSAYEKSRSYLDPFMSCPTDELTSAYIQKLINKPLDISFWDWNISPNRIIRMCQFSVER